MGLPFSEEAEPMDADPAVLEYFIFSFTADFGEVMQDLIAEEQNNVPAKAAFLQSYNGRKGTPFFYALMLRSRGGRKSLDTSGFAGAFLTR